MNKLIKPEDIDYQIDEVENTDIKDIISMYDDSILIFVGISLHLEDKKCEYITLLQYKEYKKVIQGEATARSTAESYLKGIDAAIENIKDGNRIVVVNHCYIGIKNGFMQKGPNGEFTHTMLQKIKDANCKLTECIFLGGASKINDYIYQFTDQPERKVKKEEIRKKVGEYRVKVYNECIDDVLKILREEKVDSDIIGRIIGLKEENQG